MTPHYCRLFQLANVGHAPAHCMSTLVTSQSMLFIFRISQKKFPYIPVRKKWSGVILPLAGYLRGLNHGHIYVSKFITSKVHSMALLQVTVRHLFKQQNTIYTIMVAVWRSWQRRWSDQRSYSTP